MIPGSPEHRLWIAIYGTEAQQKERERLKRGLNMHEELITIEGKTLTGCLTEQGNIFISIADLRAAGFTDRPPEPKGEIESVVGGATICGVKGYILQFSMSFKLEVQFDDRLTLKDLINFKNKFSLIIRQGVVGPHVLTATVLYYTAKSADRRRAKDVKADVINELKRMHCYYEEIEEEV
jgi:hypothetical protein